MIDKFITPFKLDKKSKIKVIKGFIYNFNDFKILFGQIFSQKTPTEYFYLEIEYKPLSYCNLASNILNQMFHYLMEFPKDNKTKNDKKSNINWVFIPLFDFSHTDIDLNDKWDGKNLSVLIYKLLSHVLL